MKLLIDTSTHGRLSRELAESGHDVLTVVDGWPEDPGDRTILARAFAENRIVITRDTDFGELAVLQGQAHCGIIRLWNTPVALQIAVCESVLQQYGQELLLGAIVTASPYRIRIRPPMNEDSSNG